MPSTETMPGQESSDFDSDSPPPPSRQKLVNQNVLRKIRLAIEADPEVDMLSIIPKSYASKMKKASTSPSAAAILNRSTIDTLHSLATEAPEIDLFSNFPRRYCIEYAQKIEEMAPAEVKAVKPIKAPRQPRDTLTHLAGYTTASILSPLSAEAEGLILQGDSCVRPPIDSESLARAFKQLLRRSEKLWEHELRGAVYRCNADLVVKVVHCDSETTEHTAMQYLESHAPNIPAPRPHGLLRLGSFSGLFMSYIPSITLEAAWPTLLQEQKLDVQEQLNCIMTELRQLKRPAGFRLGGVGGEGVKDLHRGEYRSDKVIETLAEFEEFKFSLSNFASAPYIELLKTLLPPPPQAWEPVFSHGDFRPANIMVEMDAQRKCVVTGIIDWENSGFYPDFHESTKCTNVMNAHVETDWYQYLPACIAPSSYPQWWLVDRLWDRNMTHGL